MLVPALDAVFPPLPAETAVIALGVATAGSADPRIGVLAGLAALGAFLGGNAAYLLGRRFGPVIGRRVFGGERGGGGGPGPSGRWTGSASGSSSSAGSFPAGAPR
jgi:membrane protein YqaA with SNARE-associated domain